MNFTGLSDESRKARLAALDDALAQAKSVLHLGAHLGQEADAYAKAGKPVIWVEALPHIHARLEERLKSFSGQRAFCALLGETDGKPVVFNVSNNWEGVSSSLFAFGPYGAGDKSLWPDLGLKMIDSVALTMTTLDALVARERIAIAHFDYWVVDLQGAELLALQGAEKSLPACRSMLVEISQAPVYEGGVLWTDLKRFLIKQGFSPVWDAEKTHDDVLFSR